MAESRRWPISRAVLVCAVLALLCGAAAAFEMPLAGEPWAPYAVERVLSCGPYDACVWVSLSPDAPVAYRVVTIEREGQLVVVHDWATGLGTLSGTDIDGSGWPNLIVETYSGGAHCCFASYVYDLADPLVAVALPPPPGGNAAGEFADLDADGVFEFVTADDSFAYVYCAYAGSPAVRVILAYDAHERRYAPASSRFPDLYAADIERDTERARAACSDGADLGWDGTAKCEVLPLVLDLLYAGDTVAARVALETYYDAADRETFWDEILRTVEASAYFSAR